MTEIISVRSRYKEIVGRIYEREIEYIKKKSIAVILYKVWFLIKPINSHVECIMKSGQKLFLKFMELLRN